MNNNLQFITEQYSYTILILSETIYKWTKKSAISNPIINFKFSPLLWLHVNFYCLNDVARVTTQLQRISYEFSKTIDDDSSLKYLQAIVIVIISLFLLFTINHKQLIRNILIITLLIHTNYIIYETTIIALIITLAVKIITLQP